MEVCSHKDIDALNDLAYSLRITMAEEAVRLAEQALRLSEGVGYSRGIGCALRTIAAATVPNCLPTAYQHAVHAIDLLTKERDFFNASSAYPVLYLYYTNTGQKRLALSALEKCIEFARMSDNGFVESIGLYNLGFLLQSEARYEEAVSTFQESAEAALGSLNYPTYGVAMTELAILFARGVLPTYKYTQLLRIIELVRDLPKMAGFAECVRAQVVYFYASGDRLNAVRAYRAVRNHYVATKNSREFLRSLRTMATYQELRGDLKRARRTYLAELRMLRNAEIKLGESEALTCIARIEHQLGMYREASEHLHELLVVKSNLYCEDAEARHRELEIEHQTAELATEAQESRRQAEALSAVNEQLHVALGRQAELQKELMRLASTDELTGAVNRRQIVNDGILEMERYRHTGSRFSVTVIDVDHFKSINDTFGHATGDEVLRRLTKCCQALLRRFDVFGRLGGEEFCIVHHDTDMHGAQMAVQRVMDAVKIMFMADILPDRQFSVSMGVAEVHECDASFYDVLHHADTALYEAKRAGRNTYRMAQSRTLEAA